MNKKYKRKLLLGSAMAGALLLSSCSFQPVVLDFVGSPKAFVPPDPNVLYENALVVNDVGDGLNIDVRSSFDFSEYGDSIMLDISTIYYTIGTNSYVLQSVDVASDLVESQYASVTDALSAGVMGEWSIFVRRNATSKTISFACLNNYLGAYDVSDFTLDSTAYTNGYGFITYDSAGRRYFYYSVYFPNGAPTEIRTNFISKFVNVPFTNFMSGYTRAGGDKSGLYTQTEYVQYGQSEYNRGKEDGLAQRQTNGFDDLAGAIVDVPINVLAGLSVFTVFDTPIIGIIITFLLIAVVLWIIKKVLAR